jgi:hypothetical protein
MRVKDVSQLLREAEQRRETALGVLAQDFAKAFAGSGWTPVLRDEHDATALVSAITNILEHRAFLDALYAAADQAQRQPGSDAPRSAGIQNRVSSRMHPNKAHGLPPSRFVGKDE